MSGYIFISHASADDAFVKVLREKLEAHQLAVWVDSRNLRGGDQLRPEIEQAIRTARHFLVVISPETINSDWVFDEIKVAEQVVQEKQDYRAIPLMLPGIAPKALKRYFKEEPAGETIELEIGSLQEAMPRVLAALGERLPDDLPQPDVVENKPVAELLLELSEPTLTRDENGAEQLSARAELTCIPPDVSTERPVQSRPFRFTAPIGQIEQDDIRWYLEEYFRWPVGLFRERAERTETQLPEWGQALFAASLGHANCQQVMEAWRSLQIKSQIPSVSPKQRLQSKTFESKGSALQQKQRVIEGSPPLKKGEQGGFTAVELRFSVQVDPSTLEAGDTAQENANEAASRLQSLPWELLHDDGYLSDGANPIRIRRRLPNFKQQPPSLTELPIRILLLSPRPEEKGVGYIDHRASALPLVQAVASLGDLVQLTVLSPPTLAALESELHWARDAGTPYEVLHFDGHGVYDKQHGLGTLCFENPNDTDKLEGRRNELVHADKLAKLLKDFRIPLVFLEACQTAQTEEDPNASVAASLLEEGVTSVVAMSHSVLVATAKRFVTEFYQALAQGQRVGAAMLAGQKTLMRNTYRLPIPGAGDLHLQDWFVPILYQEQHDPQLFQWIPSTTAQKLQAQQQQTRLGWLPEPPKHTFIGRSRDLLKAERLLEQQPYAVLRGQGGAGKTTLAVELARWLVQSRRFERCAFVSVEEYTHDRAVVEALLQQLVNAKHNLAAEYAGDIEQALQAIRRTLENERTLIVVDNVESLLADEAHRDEVLAQLPEAKLIFTTRESLPAPFQHKAREIKLGALSPDDAKALVMQVMNNEGLSLRHDDSGNTPEEVNTLVRSVGCHARALVLLARELAQRGVTATTANVREIMQELEQRFPGEREQSLFASVELSLRRLSAEVRGQIAGLAVFQDGGHMASMAHVLEVEGEQLGAVIQGLIEVGLAQPIGEYGYIRLDPALPSYLGLGLNAEQRSEYQQRWREVMGQLVGFLYQQQFQDAKLAAQLTQLELPNLMGYLQGLVAGWQAGTRTAEEVAAPIRRVEQLLANLNQEQALAQVVVWREQVSAGFGEWSHARFQHQTMSINRQLQAGDVQGAFQAAQALLQQSQQAGKRAYAGADYDLAVAHFTLGNVLNTGGAATQALLYLQEAQHQLEVLEERGQRMVTSVLEKQGNCLLNLGELEKAAIVYKQVVSQSEELEDSRQIAVGKGQLATVRNEQKRYADALQGYQEALDLFQQLGEPSMVATAWHQMGITYMKVGEFEQAEQAYRESMSINSQQRNKVGVAVVLNGLGNLYGVWNRPEQAMNFFRQAVDIYVNLGDLRYEGSSRSNVANTLIKLQRYDEARPELLRAIECNEPYGHAAEPWKTWSILYDLEQASGNPQAALEARHKALGAYLAYRRDDGENHSGAGRLALAVGQAIQQGDTKEIEQVVRQLLETDDWQDYKNFLHKLQAIIARERDLALAEDEELSYDLAAELIVLLESL